VHAGKTVSNAKYHSKFPMKMLHIPCMQILPKTYTHIINYSYMYQWKSIWNQKVDGETFCEPGVDELRMTDPAQNWEQLNAGQLLRAVESSSEKWISGLLNNGICVPRVTSNDTAIMASYMTICKMVQKLLLGYEKYYCYFSSQKTTCQMEKMREIWWQQQQQNKC
jgi:hypothetical protein